MKKIISLISLCSILFLVSCAKHVEEPTLRLLIGGMQQPSEKTFFRLFVKVFEAEYDINVEVIYDNPDNLYNVVSGELISGEFETDLIMVDTAHIRPFIESDIMQDLSWIDAYPDRTITDIFNDYTHQAGNRYFVPISYDVYMSIYHKDILPFLPSTVEVERNDLNEITEIKSITWEDFFETARNAKAALNQSVFGFPYAQVSSQLIYPISGMILSMGDYQLPSFYNTESLKVWQMIESLYDDGALMTGNQLNQMNQPTDSLNNNILKMSFGHMGPIGTAYQANPNRYVLGPAPKSAETGYMGTTAGAWTYGMIKYSKQLALAEKWIEFISDPEINYMYTSGLGGVMSPIQEVIHKLDKTPTDQIMKIGLSMVQSPIRISIVETDAYQSWDQVKRLYVSLYQDMIDGETITMSELSSYQNQLESLRK